jgi:hypothetical protein
MTNEEFTQAVHELVTERLDSCKLSGWSAGYAEGVEAGREEVLAEVRELLELPKDMPIGPMADCLIDIGDAAAAVLAPYQARFQADDSEVARP